MRRTETKPSVTREELERDASSTKHAKWKLSLQRRYEELCARRSTRPYPPAYDTMSTFILKYFNDNGQSAKSIRSVKSALKTLLVRQDLGWLSATDQLKLEEAMKEMEFRDTEPTRRAKPLVKQGIMKMREVLDLNRLWELMFLVMVVVSHQGLLRSGELLSGLRCRDLERDLARDEYVLSLKRSKRNRKGGAEVIRLGRTAGELNAVDLLDLWIERLGISGQPDALIFPVVTRGGRVNPGRQTSTDWFRRAIHQVAMKAGLGPGYRGHSPRAGGATDLFVARVPYHIVKKAGRWASDAVMVYYRDDDDVVKAVNDAFKEAERAGGVRRKSSLRH